MRNRDELDHALPEHDFLSCSDTDPSNAASQRACRRCTALALLELGELRLKTAAIESALRDYHLALDRRQHGGVAQNEAFQKIEAAMQMHWQSGHEKTLREAAKGE